MFLGTNDIWQIIRKDEQFVQFMCVDEPRNLRKIARLDGFSFMSFLVRKIIMLSFVVLNF